MRKVLPILIVLSVLAITSCKHNVCDGVVCNNGGYCEDGHCHCLPQWGGASCDAHSNPCDTTHCYNNSTCSNGVCTCAPHTSGPDCSIQEAPTYMYIPRLSVGKFSPASSTGQQWDSDGSAADIYMVIKQGNNVVFDGSTDYFRKDDANYTSWFSITLGGDSVLINDIYNTNYRMELWDRDPGGTDQLMNGFNFTPYSSTGGFPGSIDFVPTNFYDSLFEMHVYFNYRW